MTDTPSPSADETAATAVAAPSVEEIQAQLAALAPHIEAADQPNIEIVTKAFARLKALIEGPEVKALLDEAIAANNRVIDKASRLQGDVYIRVMRLAVSSMKPRPGQGG